MEEARIYTLRKKVRLILSKLFPVFRKLEVGDKGLMFLVGTIEGKRMEMQPDGIELVIQSIKIDNAEKIEKLDSVRI